MYLYIISIHIFKMTHYSTAQWPRTDYTAKPTDVLPDKVWRSHSYYHGVCGVETCAS